MALEGQRLLSSRSIPQLDHLVRAAADDPPAVRAEGDADDPVGVSPEGQRLPTGGRIPQLDCLVRAAADDPFAVRAEGDAEDPVGVSLEGQRFLSTGSIPQLDRLVRAAADDLFAVRAEGDAEDMPPLYFDTAEAALLAYYDSQRAVELRAKRRDEALHRLGKVAGR